MKYNYAQGELASCSAPAVRLPCANDLIINSRQPHMQPCWSACALFEGQLPRVLCMLMCDPACDLVDGQPICGTLRKGITSQRTRRYACRRPACSTACARAATCRARITPARLSSWMLSATSWPTCRPRCATAGGRPSSRAPVEELSRCCWTSCRAWFVTIQGLYLSWIYLHCQRLLTIASITLRRPVRSDLLL